MSTGRGLEPLYLLGLDMHRLAFIAVIFAVCGCQSLVIVRGPNRNIDRVIVEVDWTTPVPPSDLVLGCAKSIMLDICSPNVTVEFRLGEQISVTTSMWNDGDLRSVASNNQKDPESFYMLWVDGYYTPDLSVNGRSWGKRCFALFPKSIPADNVAISTIVHEWLHCLGLVNKFLEMQTSHEGSRDHCDDKACVMAPEGAAMFPCKKCLDDLEAGEE